MRPLNVLVIEDEAIITLDLQEQLAALGHRVLGSAKSWSEAEPWLGDQSIDLLFVDINLMGELDGFEIARRFQWQREIPVLFCTGSAEDLMQRQLSEFGPNMRCTYLIKPLDYNAIRESIAQLGLGE